MAIKAYKLTLSLVLTSHRIKAPKELKMNLGVELVLAVDRILPFQAALHCIVATLEQLQSFLYFFSILSLFQQLFIYLKNNTLQHYSLFYLYSI